MLKLFITTLSLSTACIAHDHFQFTPPKTEATISLNTMKPKLRKTYETQIEKLDALLAHLEDCDNSAAEMIKKFNPDIPENWRNCNEAVKLVDDGSQSFREINKQPHAFKVNKTATTDLLKCIYPVIKDFIKKDTSAVNIFKGIRNALLTQNIEHVVRSLIYLYISAQVKNFQNLKGDEQIFSHSPEKDNILFSRHRNLILNNTIYRRDAIKSFLKFPEIAGNPDIQKTLDQLPILKKYIFGPTTDIPEEIFLLDGVIAIQSGLSEKLYLSQSDSGGLLVLDASSIEKLTKSQKDLQFIQDSGLPIFSADILPHIADQNLITEKKMLLDFCEIGASKIKLNLRENFLNSIHDALNNITLQKKRKKKKKTSKKQITNPVQNLEPIIEVPIEPIVESNTQSPPPILLENNEPTVDTNISPIKDVTPGIQDIPAPHDDKIEIIDHAPTDHVKNLNDTNTTKTETLSKAQKRKLAKQRKQDEAIQSARQNSEKHKVEIAPQPEEHIIRRQKVFNASTHPLLKASDRVEISSSTHRTLLKNIIEDNIPPTTSYQSIVSALESVGTRIISKTGNGDRRKFILPNGRKIFIYKPATTNVGHGFLRILRDGLTEKWGLTTDHIVEPK